MSEDPQPSVGMALAGTICFGTFLASVWFQSQRFAMYSLGLLILTAIVNKYFNAKYA